MSTQTKTTDLPQGPLRLLLGLAVTESLLAIFQWVELLILRRGGTTLCGINETFNCDTVWNSRFASAVHDTLGVPVAGLGLVWGLAAVFLCAAVLSRKGKDQAQLTPALVPALRFLAVIGATSCIGFGAASAMTGSLCITCLGTYVLVLAFAVVALWKLPGPFLPSPEQMPRALLWTIGPALAGYVLVLVPGMMTPHAPRPGEGLVQKMKPQADASAATGSALDQFLAKLSPEEAQGLAEALQEYRHGLVGPALPARLRKGPENAPLKIVEFTDIRCGHCRALVEAMNQMEPMLPPGGYSLEARHFPLDSDCNALMKMSDNSKIRCTGAKAQICLESQPDYWALRDKLFSEQETLTPARILEIASSGAMKQGELEACMASPETARKLAEDVNYAAQVKPRGTPIVLLNGRSSPAMPGFIYAMVLAGGNSDAPEFAKLPSPGAPLRPE